MIAGLRGARTASSSASSSTASAIVVESARGRGRRRRRDRSTSPIAPLDDEQARAVRAATASSPTAPGTTPASTSASDARPGAVDRRPGTDHRAAPDHRRRARLAGRLTARNHIVLTRVAPLAEALAIGTDADPVMLEVFNNLFMSIAEQMGVTLQNTAYSVNIKERLDFSCARLRRRRHASSPTRRTCRSISARWTARSRRSSASMPATSSPGDVFALNAPYNGGTHLPDITVCTPVFDRSGNDDPVLGRLARPPRRCRRHGAGIDDAARHHRRGGRRPHRQLPPGRSAASFREAELVRAAHRSPLSRAATSRRTSPT